MPRPRLADRPIRLEIKIPESLHARIQLALYSPAEQRVPHGAWSALIKTLLTKAFNQRETGNGAQS